MASIVTYDAQHLLLQPLPDLNVTPYRTTSDAIHHVKFIGALRPWANFEREVQRTYDAEFWNPNLLAVMSIPSAAQGTIDREHVFVCDERGIQGRFEGRAGTRVGAVFRNQYQGLQLGAYKGVLPPYSGYTKEPDFVLKDQTHFAKVVGEAKTPWISKHDLDAAIQHSEAGIPHRFRNLLGQIAEYMFDLGLQYGFLTTYEQTIFLRKVNIGYIWGLEYSPVIEHNRRGEPSQRTLSLCQCLFHIGLLAESNPVFDKTFRLRNQQWTTRIF